MSNKQDAPSPDVAGLIEALQGAYDFIASEYRDEKSAALDGEPFAKEARPVIAAIGTALSRLAPPKQDECCVPDEDEPQFVLLGRDPQAPALVDEWARVRRLAEPESPKPAMAGIIAARMRAYKLTHPEKGMAASALPNQDDARKGQSVSDYDMSIHTNPDAQEWARFYIECKAKSPDPAAFDAEDNMIGWFANAMMAMHDHLTGAQGVEDKPMSTNEQDDAQDSTVGAEGGRLDFGLRHSWNGGTWHRSGHHRQ